MRMDESLKKTSHHEGEMKKILIADANKLFRALIKQVISDHFEAVLTSEACDEREVIDEISHHAYDVLLLDLGLSDNKGLTVLRKMMVIAPNIPVVIMSLFPDEQCEENIYRAGYDGYICKVNLVYELIPALNDIFEGKRHFRSPMHCFTDKQMGAHP